MLGMLQTPQPVPRNQPPVSQTPQADRLAPQPVIQPPQGPVGFTEQPSAQVQVPARQVQNHPVPGIRDAGPEITIPSPSISAQLPQMNQKATGQLNIQMPHRPVTHASLPTNVPQSGYYTPQQSSHHSHVPIPSNTYSTSNMLHPSMQPPLPPQPRPTTQSNFIYQPNQQTVSGFHHSNAPHMLHSQPSFQGNNSHFRPDMSNAVGNPMQVERGAPWAPVIPENPSILPVPPPLTLNPMAPGNQAPRPPPMTPEMEKALLQQVMSLTPEQINLLPPDQRQQVHQLQQMLRQ